MALTDYIFNLSYFHIGQLAQKTQNLQKLWCVHVLKTPVPTVLLQLNKFLPFSCVHRDCAQQPLRLQVDSRFMIVLLSKCCTWKKKTPLRIPEVIFPFFYFFKKYFFSDSEIMTMFCFSSNRFSCYTHTCTSGSLNWERWACFPHNLSMHSGVSCTFKELKKNGHLD